MTRPLEGIRIFDLTNAAVGPIATELLAGMGADVIKVESPEGEMMHTMVPKQRGFAAAYTSHNFNKRAIILDLKNEADRAKAYRLLETCDVFVENFRTGVATRLGVDYETVAGVNPRIVYVSASAWGSRGPMRALAGVDPNLQAFSGFASLNGKPGGGGEFHRGYGHIDATTASYIAAAILQALIHRHQTGKGTHIEIEMLSAAMTVQLTRVAEYFAGGAKPIGEGSATASSAPNQAFSCSNKKHLAVAVETDAQWRGLCAAIREPDLETDPRFATTTARIEHRQELSERLAAVFAKRPSIWWTKELTRHGVPSSLFYDFEMLRDHAQIVDNGMLVTIDLKHQGTVMTAGYPWRFSGSEVPVLPAPAPGEHTDEVMASLEAKGQPAPAAAPRQG